MFRRPTVSLLFLFLALWVKAGSAADDFTSLGNNFAHRIQPLLKQFCLDCHSKKERQGELDLERFAALSDVRRDPKAWQKVAEMIDNGEMPPEDSPQPTAEERKKIRGWVEAYLNAEALANAGDPGPVILRRLSNAEYNYTVRDLTGVESLDPTREFPVDSAAGEGFTNTGSAQAMSPALVQKYFDAAKDVADHLVLLPDGIRFSPHVSERDRTDDLVAAIRRFYQRFTVTTDVNIQVGGAGKVPNEAGTIPLEKYLAATLEERDELLSGSKTIEQVAKARGLNAKYLGILWKALSQPPERTSRLLDAFRQKWKAATSADVEKLALSIREQQNVLFKYNTIGHIGKQGQPKEWLEPVAPIAATKELSLDLPVGKAEETSVYLIASDAGDGNDHDFVVWENPRLTKANSPDIFLRDLAGLQKRIAQLQKETLARTSDYLAAAREVEAKSEFSEKELDALAAKHRLDAKVLKEWLGYLAIGDGGAVAVEGHIKEKQQNGSYDFIRGWGVDATPIVLANSSDNQVRIPGIARPHRITVHPSPTLFVAAGWQSPITGLVRIEADIRDAHPECGNGQEWFLQHRTGRKVGNLWKGDFGVGGSAKMTAKTVSVSQGDLITFLVGPRQGNHSCDLTEINLAITELDGKKRSWDLAKDCSGDLQSANPHQDGYGNAQTWHFYQGPMASLNRQANEFVTVPAGSLLSSWQKEKNPAQRVELAEKIQKLATGKPPAETTSPDGLLYNQLMNVAMSPRDLEPLLADVEPDKRFAGGNLVVQAPAVTEFRIPAALADGRTLITTGRLDPKDGREGSVQLALATSKLEPAQLRQSDPVIVNDGSEAKKRVEASFADFQNLFPPALCYARIVPVDEVVTLTLWYRQDDHLRRLMLSDQEAAELDRLWDELFYVAKEPLKYQVAFEQIREFATQDRPDLVKVWSPLVESVEQRTEAFRRRLIDTEPAHLNSLLEFAELAWRRPLSDAERKPLRELYQKLREAELPHEDAIRLTLARVLTSPAFLYRREVSHPTKKVTPVSDHELAARLSYFLWSSAPDRELRNLAKENRLGRDESLKKQAQRMLKDAKTKRLAIQFACQWLHVRNFDQDAEKNERLYPEFASLRGEMYEETVRFFEDMFRNDGSILSMLDADHTFVNEALAKHYGIGGVKGDWRRIDGVRSKGRGGVLGMATVLASQSGASRTSPILRGNWVYETLLGERLPRPPAGVPVLPDEPPKGLTARQLIEQHSSAPACAKCHAKIDPYGFALEQYDAIGGLRSTKVDTKTKLAGGKTIDGIEGLRDYLLNERREDFVRQFCRKLLGYALGREIQLSDRPLIEKMMKDLAENDYRFSAAVEAVVLSDQFRRIRGNQDSSNLKR